MCGAPMTMNLRCDDKFVQDEGWYAAANRYDDFLRRHQNLHLLFLELGVGGNTPVIIKYPFWKMTAQNPRATYACINFGAATAPAEIKNQSICIDADIASVLVDLKNFKSTCMQDESNKKTKHLESESLQGAHLHNRLKLC